MVDNKEGDFTVNYFDENDQKNNLASTMRFDLIKGLIRLLTLCISFLRQPKKAKTPHSCHSNKIEFLRVSKMWRCLFGQIWWGVYQNHRSITQTQPRPQPHSKPCSNVIILTSILNSVCRSEPSTGHFFSAWPAVTSACLDSDGGRLLGFLAWPGLAWQANRRLPQAKRYL